MTSERGTKHSILHFLLEEGTATVQQLVEFTGVNIRTLRNAISHSMDHALIQRADEPRTNPALYGLTRLGTEEAIRLSALVVKELQSVVDSQPKPQGRVGDVATDVATTTAQAVELGANAHGWTFAAEQASPPPPNDPSDLRNWLTKRHIDATPPSTIRPALSEHLVQVKADSLVLEAVDTVCAMNSRGELAIDLGDGHQVKFQADQALIVKRFLANTSVLEELHSMN